VNHGEDNSLIKYNIQVYIEKVIGHITYVGLSKIN